MNGVSERAFDPADMDIFPDDWLSAAPGVRITSALIRVEERPGDEVICKLLSDWFVPESLAVSRVIDDEAIVSGDFRIDPAGHLRFGVFVTPGIGRRRAGRIVQRLCEIETYKTMSMLGFTRVRELGPRMGEIDNELNRLMAAMTNGDGQEEDRLKALLSVSAELESLSAQTSSGAGRGLAAHAGRSGAVGTEPATSGKHEPACGHAIASAEDGRRAVCCCDQLLCCIAGRISALSGG